MKICEKNTTKYEIFFAGLPPRTRLSPRPLVLRPPPRLSTPVTSPEAVDYPGGKPERDVNVLCRVCATHSNRKLGIVNTEHMYRPLATSCAVPSAARARVASRTRMACSLARAPLVH